MSTLIKIVTVLIVSILSTSCLTDFSFSNGVKGNGNVITEDRQPSADFSVVSAHEGLDVFISQGDEHAISIEADENIADLIITEVKEGELKIHCEKPIGKALSKKVYVQLPDLTGVVSTSGADVESMGSLQVSSLHLEASSGADIRIEVEATDVHAESSSGSDIFIYGTTDRIEAEASSGSDINADKLQARTARAEASSGADILLNSSESLEVETSSGGDVKNAGQARRIAKD
ncbi:head GIN domain-containing protein [Robertkochia aurantiaca]|uniref:head GIN domain-containing protein n=1 Tax=Robertkochia aurantiaca TaxID=2873700 RepID=UPI001CCDBFD1|nr:head GIN domain-containing protein [Robertkochia sp. 3YJGBD-33]